jgi:hypothetical protein
MQMLVWCGVAINDGWSGRAIAYASASALNRPSGPIPSKYSPQTMLIWSDKYILGHCAMKTVVLDMRDDVDERDGRADLARLANK